MVRTVSRSKVHLIREKKQASYRSAVHRTARPVSATVISSTAENSQLSVRLAQASDQPWIQSWTTQLNLPYPRINRVRAYILQENGQRVGYMAGRDSMLNLGNGVEPAMWIVGAFLIPSKRGKGLLPRFGAILSKQVYPHGNVLARVAATNSRMHQYMAFGRWRKIRSTRRYTDYSLVLHTPYKVQNGVRPRL